MFLLQLFDELDAEIYSVGFEVDEIESAAVVGGVQLPGEVD